MEKSISKIQKDFPAKIFTGINACLRMKDAISATILICCAVDLLAKYYSGDISLRSNKKNYISFLRKFFPGYNPPEEFYQFVRCGLVHAYNMEQRYILISSNAEWAQNLNMKWDEKHKAVIINPYRLRKDLKRALESFIKELQSNKELRKKTRQVYKKYPLVRQTMKIAKFKHLREETTT